MPGEKTATRSVAVIVVVAVLFISFFILPSILSKYGLSKPSLGEGEPVEPRHIQWLVAELGAGNLQSPAGAGGTPEIEFVVNPGDQYFSVTIENGVPKTKSGPADDPDIRLSGNRDVIARLLAADDLFAEVGKLSEEGKVKLDMLKGRDELAGVGYESLYNELTHSQQSSKKLI